MSSPTPTPAGSASRKVSSGVMWNTAFTFTKDALQFGLTMTLARLLTPETYGQFSFISSITTLAAAVSFRNFLAHSLQLRSDEHVDYDQHATFGIFVQTGVFLVVNIVAAGFWFSALRPLAIPLATMSVLLFVDIPNEICSRMLERDLNWSTLRTLNLVGFIAGGASSLILAIMGAGLYALLIPNLIFPIPLAIHLFLVRKWRFRWTWSALEYRVQLRFGGARMLSGLLGQARGVLETTTIAGLLSFSALGIYGRATGLSQLFIYRFIFLLMTSAYPVLTTVVGGAFGSRRAGVLLLRAICWGSAAAGLLLSFAASPIIRIIYGPQWVGAIPLVAAAVISRIAAGHRYAVTSLLLAENEARRCVWIDGISLGVFTITLLALTRSVRAFLYIDGAAQFAVAVLGLWWLSKQNWSVFRATLEPLFEAATCAALVWLPLRFILPFATDLGSQLALGVLAATIFLIVLRVMFSGSMLELLRLLPFPDITCKLFVFQRSERPASA
jgi:O-antigen/teichoic acid export membrane protein